MNLIDGRYIDMIMVILIVETFQDDTDRPVLIKVNSLKKDKWGIFPLSLANPN